MRLIAAWNRMRESPRPQERAAWWISVAAGILVLAALVTTQPLALGIWVAGNLCLLLAALGWGLAHPRAVLRAGLVPWRWGFWVSAVLTFVLLGLVEQGLAEAGETGPTFSASARFLFTGIGFVGLWVLTGLTGYLGAALGAFGGRNSREPRAAASGVVGFWLVAALGAEGEEIFRFGDGPMVAGAFIGAIPLLTVLAAAWLNRPGHRPLELCQRAIDRFSERLVFRRRTRSGVRQVDLRGAAVGALSALTALALANTQAVMLLRAQALVSLIQFRNEPLVRGAPVSLGWLRSQESRLAPDRIVLLDMDAPVRREAALGRSEASIQADVIRRLKSWGAAEVILPLPMGRPADGGDAASPEIPRASPESLRRSAQDLPELARAMREAGNVILSLPPEPPGWLRQVRDQAAGRPPRGPGGRGTEDGGPRGEGPPRADSGPPTPPEPGDRPPAPPDPTPLARAARGVGRAALDSFGSHRLPAIPVEREAVPVAGHPFHARPLPVVLFAAVRGRAPEVRPARRRGWIEFAGEAFPLIAPGKVLVEFLSPRPRAAFPVVSYSGLFEELPLFPRGTEPHRLQLGGPRDPEPLRPVPPAEYFRGKIVFLDSLGRAGRETPIGPMPSAELQAHALSTLLSGNVMRPFPFPSLALWTLVMGTWAGAFSTRRDPLTGGLRAAVAVFAWVVLAGFALTVWEVWLDPVLPGLAAVAAWMLATQLTFRMERTERERNRAMLVRFVGPQVEQIIDDPDALRRLGLGGERQKVCVLFADVRNFTRFAERHTPEEVISTVNAYMTALTEALFRHGGILDKYTGDGLMAFFPVAGEPREDVSGAVTAALALRDTAQAVSAELDAEGREALQVGIGMHYGEVVVGLVGPAYRTELTALGHAVIVSHRLQGLASGGEVIVSETVFFETSGAFRTEAVPPVDVKGISEPIHPYRVLAADPEAELRKPLPAPV